MDGPDEIMQQPIRKAVGRPLTLRKRLLAVEHLAQFIRKHAPQDHTPKPSENTSQFEKLLAKLVSKSEP